MKEENKNNFHEENFITIENAERSDEAACTLQSASAGKSAVLKY